MQPCPGPGGGCPMSRQFQALALLLIGSAASFGFSGGWFDKYNQKPVPTAPTVGVVTPNAMTTGLPKQRVETVASVDARTQTIHLVGGDVVRGTPSTKVGIGTVNARARVGDLRAGDKIIVTEARIPSPVRVASRQSVIATSDPDASSPSALPRDVAAPSSRGQLLEV